MYANSACAEQTLIHPHRTLCTDNTHWNNEYVCIQRRQRPYKISTSFPLNLITRTPHTHTYPHVNKHAVSLITHKDHDDLFYLHHSVGVLPNSDRLPSHGSPNPTVAQLH
jgi:hypothetical protein